MKKKKILQTLMITFSHFIEDDKKSRILCVKSKISMTLRVEIRFP